jgi:hypothetical protein
MQCASVCVPLQLLNQLITDELLGPWYEKFDVKTDLKHTHTLCMKYSVTEQLHTWRLGH